jgi:hypothetical protein
MPLRLKEPTSEPGPTPQAQASGRATAHAAEPVAVPLDQIHMIFDTQARVTIDGHLVHEYAEAMTEGAKFPPVVLFRDAEGYWVGDGPPRLPSVNGPGASGRSLPVDLRSGRPHKTRLKSGMRCITSPSMSAPYQRMPNVLATSRLSRTAYSRSGAVRSAGAIRLTRDMSSTAGYKKPMKPRKQARPSRAYCP